MTGRARGFRVSLFGVHLAVVSDSAAMVEALDRYVMPWLPREAVGAGGGRSGSWRCGVPATAMGSRSWSTALSQARRRAR